MKLLDFLFGTRRERQEPDPLAEAVDSAKAAQRDALDVVNTRRRKRGEVPLTPRWEEVDPASALRRARVGP